MTPPNVDGSANTPEGSVACNATLASLGETVFRPSCATASCHNAADRAAGLDLASDTSVAAMVGAQAGTCDGAILVTPGSTDKSLLYRKIAGVPSCGARMPFAQAPLADAQIRCVAEWISGLPSASSDASAASDASANGALSDAGKQDTANASDAGAASGDTGAACNTCGTPSCVDLQVDPIHCGSCTSRCPAGSTCAKGACSCSGGLALCGSTCIDLTSTAAQCGSCGNACPTGATCSRGTCQCAGTTTACGSTCVDTSSDAKNCGACGRACATGQVCNKGACTSGCGTLTQCGGSCVDQQASASNCGACGITCPSGATCAKGSCACPSGTAVCGTTCLNVLSDPNNCGACGKVCPSGVSCVSGACSCGTGTTLCGSAGCVSTATDNNNCGACGRVCSAGQTCVNSVCACPAGKTSCGSSCVDATSDVNNCGTCGHACAPGQTCSAGACTCGTATVSFATGVQPILTASCAFNGCHGNTSPKENLNLVAGQSYGNLVNVLAKQCTDGRKRVVPSDPSNSYLVEKLLGVAMCGTGGQMPKTGQSIPQSQIQTIANWVCEGAPNN